MFKRERKKVHIPKPSKRAIKEEIQDQILMRLESFRQDVYSWSLNGLSGLVEDRDIVKEDNETVSIGAVITETDNPTLYKAKHEGLNVDFLNTLDVEIGKIYKRFGVERIEQESSEGSDEQESSENAE